MFDLIDYVLDSEGVEWLFALPMCAAGIVVLECVGYIVYKLVAKIPTCLNRPISVSQSPVDKPEQKDFVQEETPSVEKPEDSFEEDLSLEAETAKEDLLLNEVKHEIKNLQEEIKTPSTALEGCDKQYKEKDFIAAMKCIAKYSLPLDDFKREYIYQKIEERNPYWLPWEQSWLLSSTANNDDEELDTLRSQYLLALTNKITNMGADDVFTKYWFELEQMLGNYEWYDSRTNRDYNHSEAIKRPVITLSGLRCRNNKACTA